MIKLLPKFSKNIDRSVAGGKKVYFSDTGMLNIISRLNDSQILENAIINQLSFYGDISFYYKRNTAEIDAILNKEIAFEIKTTGTEKDNLKLQKLAQELKIPKHFIISKNIKQNSNFLSPTIF